MPMHNSVDDWPFENDRCGEPSVFVAVMPLEPVPGFGQIGDVGHKKTGGVTRSIEDINNVYFILRVVMLRYVRRRTLLET